MNKCTCGAQHNNEAHSDWCDTLSHIDLEIPFTAEVWMGSSNVAMDNPTTDSLMDAVLKFQIEQNELLTAYFVAMAEGRLEDAQRLSYLAKAMASKSLKA